MSVMLVEVAPYLGAWIEIPWLVDILSTSRKVAPYLGAWIEIL